MNKREIKKAQNNNNNNNNNQNKHLQNKTNQQTDK